MSKLMDVTVSVEVDVVTTLMDIASEEKRSFSELCRIIFSAYIKGRDSAGYKDVSDVPPSPPVAPESDPEIDDEKGYSTAESAAYLNLMTSAVSKLAREGKIPARKEGRKYVILGKDIKNYLLTLPTQKGKKGKS